MHKFGLLVICLSGLTFADHLIQDLEGEWYSSIFPQSVRYHFSGVAPLNAGRYIFRYRRPTDSGDCVGSGLIQLSTGKARAVEVCPPRSDGKEPVFFAVWQLVDEHHDLHLKGGYYTEGSANFHTENLDKDKHGGGRH